MKRNNVRRLTIGALMGAISFVLLYFNFGVPFLSPFAEFDLSALPELIGGFILGPAGAIEIIGIKILLILVFKGTSSAFTGEIQNFLLSCAYVLPAVLYYRRDRTKRGAMISVIIGTVASIVIAIFTNLYLVYPMYIKLFGMSWEQIIGICNSANSFIHDKLTFVLFSVIPFNLISRSVTSVITMLVYKKISIPLKKLIA